jgi:ribosomal protein S18 acetylase RimI-like enzyme
VGRRAWRGWEDLPRMQDLLARALRDRPAEAFVHPGDLAWWLGWPPKPASELAASTTVWEDDRAVLAWVAFDGDDVGECVDPDAGAPETLWSEIDQVLATRVGATRYARSDDPVAVERLRAAGYEPIEGGSMRGFALDLTGLAVSEPYAHVRAVEAGDDLRPRASVTRAAFGVDTPLDVYIERYAAFMTSPAYPVGWDLVAWASPGVAAACAIAWPDAVSRTGNFEPVATHPKFQRQGYATAVLREGSRRLRSIGMRRAIVRTPSDNHAAAALYRSVGFHEDHEQIAFRQVRGT